MTFSVLQSLEQFQDAYLASNESNLNNQTVFTFNTFAINIHNIDNTDDFEGPSFSVNLGSVEDAMNISKAIPREVLVVSDNISASATSSVQLPNDLFMSCGLSSESITQIRVSFSVFLSDVLFQNKNQRHLKVGSIVVAPRLQCNRMTLVTPITVSFRTNRMVTIIISIRDIKLLFCLLNSLFKPDRG